MAKIPARQIALCPLLLVLLLITRSGHAHTEMVSIVIGGGEIQIPIPAGFVELDEQRSAENTAPMRPAGTRLLAVLSEQQRASANGNESIAKGRIIFIESLEKFSGNRYVSPADFGELKRSIRVDESWLPGSSVADTSSDSILFETAGETMSGGYYVNATWVMLVRSRVVVFTLFQWNESHVPSSAARRLMDDWRSQCRDANRIGSRLPSRHLPLSSPFDDLPRAGGETSTEPPFGTGWGIRHENDRRLRQPGQRTNTVRRPRSWRLYPIYWLNSNAQPLLIGAAVIAFLVIVCLFIRWLSSQAVGEAKGEAEDTTEADSERSDGGRTLNYTTGRSSELTDDNGID